VNSTWPGRMAPEAPAWPQPAHADVLSLLTTRHCCAQLIALKKAPQRKPSDKPVRMCAPCFDFSHAFHAHECFRAHCSQSCPFAPLQKPSSYPCGCCHLPVTVVSVPSCMRASPARGANGHNDRKFTDEALYTCTRKAVLMTAHRPVMDSQKDGPIFLAVGTTAVCIPMLILNPKSLRIFDS